MSDLQQQIQEVNDMVTKAIKKEICAYCEENKPSREVKKWEKTGELVCYDCRLEMLEEEFNL